MPLTDTAIRAIKPTSKTAKYFDGGGLYLEVAPSGGKWWRLKYRFQGKEKRVLPGFPWVADLLMSFPEGTNEGYGPIFSDSGADRALVC